MNDEITGSILLKNTVKLCMRTTFLPNNDYKSFEVTYE